jgi:pimeloyl-ACP methyl ester carboxylesterase
MQNNQNVLTGDADCITAATRFVSINNRSLAYRVIGQGPVLVLCNRYRGMLDTWDPAFINKLATQLQVIIFDYSGIGRSGGDVSVSKVSGAADDLKDLLVALQIGDCFIGGWSYGGMVAQTFFTMFPDHGKKLILIGTPPPGKNAHPIDSSFYDVAFHPVNDLDDDYIAFFEPASELSKKLAAESRSRIESRKTDLDIPVLEPQFKEYLAGSKDFAADSAGTRNKIIKNERPILLLMGDHDICFPVENWYELNRQLTNLQIIVMPQAGHGPQHQYPDLCAAYIIQFLLTEKF